MAHNCSASWKLLYCKKGILGCLPCLSLKMWREEFPFFSWCDSNRPSCEQKWGPWQLPESTYILLKIFINFDHTCVIVLTSIIHVNHVHSLVPKNGHWGSQTWVWTSNVPITLVLVSFCSILYHVIFFLLFFNDCINLILL